jgi:hypothetical protein
VSETLKPYHFTLKYSTGTTIDVTQEVIDRAQRLIDEGWCQTSSKYRSIGRLPPGKTAIEALAEASGREEWAMRMGDASAGDHYLRVYSPKTPELRQELDIATWTAYKKLGGGTYHRHSPKGYGGKRLHNADMSLQVVMEAALALWERDPAWFRNEVVTDHAQFIDILEQLKLRRCGANIRTYARMWGMDNPQALRRWEDEAAEQDPPEKAPDAFDSNLGDGETYTQLLKVVEELMTKNGTSATGPYAMAIGYIAERIERHEIETIEANPNPLIPMSVSENLEHDDD